MAMGESQGGRGGCSPGGRGHRPEQGGGRLARAVPQGRGPSSAPPGAQAPIPSRSPASRVTSEQCPHLSNGDDDPSTLHRVIAGIQNV